MHATCYAASVNKYLHIYNYCLKRFSAHPLPEADQYAYGEPLDMVVCLLDHTHKPSIILANCYLI